MKMEMNGADSVEPGCFDEDLLHVATTMLGTSLSEKVVARWQRAKSDVRRMSTARRQSQEARAKALQRTPYPIVVTRLRLLLEKIAIPLAQRPVLLSHVPRHPLTQKHPSKAEATSPRTPQTSPRSEPHSSARSLYDSYLDEASLLLAHVSSFLRMLPEEMRRELSGVIHVEEKKREDVIFNIGEAPEKFYVILTGMVEVTEKLVTNDRREKYVIANLKKGHVFGEAAILNNGRRNATCVAMTHCVLLTVLKEDFLAVVGPYFFGQKRETITFLRTRVTVFKDVDREACLALLAFLMRVDYPPDKEWDIQKEKYLYFIRRGVCGMCVADAASVATGGDGQRKSDVLDGVVVVNGRPFGALTKEARRRAHDRRAPGRKELASLSPGDWFGGGWSLVGDGKRVSSLRVVAKTHVEAFVLPVEDLLTYADPEIIRRLREDASFRLTYYFGRKGLLETVHEVIGHSTVAMLSGVEMLKREVSQKHHRVVQRQLNHDTDVGGSRFCDRTESILHHYRELSAANALDVSKAQYDGGTPTERFWADASLTRGPAHFQLGPLLKDIFPQGFDPLSKKIDRMMQLRSSGTQKPGKKKWLASLHSVSAARRPHTAPALNASRKEIHIQDDTTYPGKADRRKRDLLAASVMWERATRPATAMRQCLTYAEIVRNKDEMC